MAKKIKRAKVRTKVITKTRRIYVGAKKKARSIRRAGGEKMSTSDIVLAVAGAGVGSIGGSIVLAKMPAAVPDIAKNGILAGLGGFVAYKGLKKKNRLLLGVGMGAAAAAATNLIGGLISGGTTVSGCSPALAAPYSRVRPVLAAPYSNVRPATMAAPLAAPYDGEEM